MNSEAGAGEAAPHNPATAGSDKEPALKRVMGPKLLLLFIVGDILGAGVYAVTGKMTSHVGGVAWLPFLLAFGVATLTAYSYMELVTKYPQAAGAALYTHKAFGIHFVTFLVAFAVICSGITSASTSSGLLASNLLVGLNDSFGMGLPDGKTAGMLVAMGFMVLLALINLRGVGESVKFNVVLTLVEMAALFIVIGIGFFAMTKGNADPSQLTVFETSSDKNMFVAVTIATAIAFFAMVGFEDSVNMVEETQDPSKIFPKIMLTGLGIAAFIYVLVAITVVIVLTPDQIAASNESNEGVLLTVVREGAPSFPIDKVFPFLTVFAVANTALINMLMASRLIYGLAKQGVLPTSLGKVLPGRRSPWAGIVFTTILALALIALVTMKSESTIVSALSGTTGLLLLCVFAVVNVACLVLRKDTTAKASFKAPTWIPVLGAVACLFLAGPWARVAEDMVQYKIAGGGLLIGIALWAITYFTHTRRHEEAGRFHDMEHMKD